MDKDLADPDPSPDNDWIIENPDCIYIMTNGDLGKHKTTKSDVF